MNTERAAIKPDLPGLRVHNLKSWSGILHMLKFTRGSRVAAQKLTFNKVPLSSCCSTGVKNFSVPHFWASLSHWLRRSKAWSRFKKTKNKNKTKNTGDTLRIFLHRVLWALWRSILGILYFFTPLVNLYFFSIRLHIHQKKKWWEDPHREVHY